jgi:hypothetical protein
MSSEDHAPCHAPATGAAGPDQCAQAGCSERHGNAELVRCGGWPEEARLEIEPGCGHFFCHRHLNNHHCARPRCREFPAEDDGSCCTLVAGHGLPHLDRHGLEFFLTDSDEEELAGL